MFFFSGYLELPILHEKAQHLRNGILRSRGDALLPLSLATFIFEALVTASGTQQMYIVYCRPSYPVDYLAFIPPRLQFPLNSRNALRSCCKMIGARIDSLFLFLIIRLDRFLDGEKYNKIKNKTNNG